MCLHASGLTDRYSIIGYSAAANANKPADVMLPLYHYVVHRYDCRLLIVGNKNQFQEFLVLVLITLIAAIIGLLMYEAVGFNW
jgi:hypothetical protein